MNGVRPDIDLAALARPTVTAAAPRRRWRRLVVPIAILIVFAVILLTSMGDLFRGRIVVTIARPKPADGGAGGSAGAVVLQAAGWAEPDPFLIQVTALVNGVVREVLVQESDAIKAQDPVARLVDEEAKLKLASAEAALARANAEHSKASAEARLARESYDRALAVTESAATSEAELTGKRAERALRAAAVARGHAQVRIAEKELELQQELSQADATGPRQLELAQAKLEEARGTLATLEADAALAAAETEKAESRATRARLELELRLEDRLRVETTSAALDLAAAAVREAEVARDEARLRLDRTIVRAPSDGVVMERLVTPGFPLQGAEHGAPICTMYDPKHLRIRVDVPQGDIAKVSVGQQAQILVEARPGKPYAGEVVRVVQKADIQKVTLQVHVRVLDGDGVLRPEMLCQVRFLAAATTDASAPQPVTTRLLVPARLLLDDQSLWVIDGAARTATRRRVQAGLRQGEWVEIESGINLSDKLIDEGREQIREGARVTIRGVD